VVLSPSIAWKLSPQLCKQHWSTLCWLWQSKYKNLYPKVHFNKAYNLLFTKVEHHQGQPSYACKNSFAERPWSSLESSTVYCGRCFCETKPQSLVGKSWLELTHCNSHLETADMKATIATIPLLFIHDFKLYGDCFLSYINRCEQCKQKSNFGKTMKYPRKEFGNSRVTT